MNTLTAEQIAKLVPSFAEMYGDEISDMDAKRLGFLIDGIKKSIELAQKLPGGSKKCAIIDAARVLRTRDVAGFKACLLALHRADVISLTRCDLPSLMSQQDQADSEIRYMLGDRCVAQFHFAQL